MAEYSIAVPPQGTIFELEDLEATPAYHKCGGVKLIRRSEASPPVNDETVLESEYQEFGVGLPDAGGLELTLQYNRADVGQAQMHVAKANREKRNGRITYPDGSVEAFSCYCLMVPHEAPAGGTSISGTASFKITGKPNWTEPT